MTVPISVYVSISSLTSFFIVRQLARLQSHLGFAPRKEQLYYIKSMDCPDIQ